MPKLSELGSMERLIPLMREIIAEGRFLDAIRVARRDGFSFPTARKMAQEIRQGASWYRPALYPPVSRYR